MIPQVYTTDVLPIFRDSSHCLVVLLLLPTVRWTHTEVINKVKVYMFVVHPDPADTTGPRQTQQFHRPSSLPQHPKGYHDEDHHRQVAKDCTCTDGHCHCHCPSSFHYMYDVLAEESKNAIRTSSLSCWWANKLAMTAFFTACSWAWAIICTGVDTAGRQHKQTKKDKRLIPFSILTWNVVHVVLVIVVRDGKKVDERRREKKKRISTAAHSLWICVALLLHLVSVTVVEAVCTPVIDSVSAANRGDLGLALDACLSESNNGVCPVFAQASNGVGCNNGGVNGVIGDWDVSALTNMQFVFKDKYYCNFDISKWDTSSVTIMEGSRWCLFSSFFNVVYRIYH